MLCHLWLQESELKQLTYRIVVRRKRSHIHNKHLHFVNKISLEVGLDLNKLVLRFRLQEEKTNIQA